MLLKKRRALISVSDKTGIEKFAKAIYRLNWEIVSTGGTVKTLKKAKIPVIPIEDVTNNPEAFGGRMKTISFQIESALLYRRDNKQDAREAEELGIFPIDMVVCNFYPFEKTVAQKNVTLKEAIDNIDIGGPTMLRAAAKNYKHVIAITDPDDYSVVLQELQKTGDISKETKEKLAIKIFERMADYDGAIHTYLARQFNEEKILRLKFAGGKETRYGENPYQRGWIYQSPVDDKLGLHRFEQLQGKEMSFNNWNDLNSALRCLCHIRAAIESHTGYDHYVSVGVKHTNPCGVGIDLEHLYKMLSGDPLAIFGGIVITNALLTKNGAELLLDKQREFSVNDRFLEIIAAPDFTQEALEIFKEKPNLRILRNTALYNPTMDNSRQFLQIREGLLQQESPNSVITGKNIEMVTEKKLDEHQILDCIMAWAIAKTSKSNTISLVKNGILVGNGVGQMDRVECAKLAIRKAGDHAKEALFASDAFFPQTDGPETLAKAGVVGGIVPSGSIKDKEIIATFDKYEMAVAFIDPSLRGFLH